MKQDRLHAITLHLSRKGKTTAEELAEMFSVSVRTIYRDVETLSLAGIPITTENGRLGGISLVEGYRLNGGCFTRSEMSTLAQYTSGLASLLSDSSIGSVANKAAAMECSSQGSSEILIDFHPWKSHPSWKKVVPYLRQAMKQQKRLSMDYVSLKNESTHRCVEPLTLVFRESHWYLHAYCLLRQEYRWFALSRIQNPELEKESYHRTKRLEKAPQRGPFSSPLVNIHLKAQSDGPMLCQDIIPHENWMFTKEGAMECHFYWPLNEWLYQWLMGLGNKVELLAPQTARRELYRRLNQAALLYQ